MKWISHAVYTLLICTPFLFVACDEDDDPPPAENEEEAITNVTLTFTPEGGGTPVTASWVDADGEGSGTPVLTDIKLAANTTYIMDIDLLNALDPDDIESITEEVREEGDEHMFFFGWTEGLFSDPAGDGNLDNRADDAVNYEDEDENDLPLGLETRWTTGEAGEGTFQLILMHQPPLGNGTPIKTTTSDISDGDTDVDITWNLIIQ